MVFSTAGNVVPSVVGEYVDGGLVGTVSMGDNVIFSDGVVEP